jgi:demethylmenaquinone methyltransferase/2-methoxy-6-polyprenyl-1,4-benzoquinol methylase
MAENIYNPEFVKGLFDRMSSSYERMNYLTSFGFSIRWRKQFLKQFKPTDHPIEIIDLMTGMGETWQGVKYTFPKATLTGLDFSTEMLKKAQRKNEQHFSNSVILVQQDILESRLSDNYYDIVICAFGLKTFDSDQLSLLANETKRILKTGGKFSFVEVSKPPNFILGKLYGFYLGKMIPILGRLLLSNPTEYKMLWRYAAAFKNAKKTAELFKSVGLNVTYISYFFGCATGFFGSK